MTPQQSGFFLEREDGQSLMLDDASSSMCSTVGTVRITTSVRDRTLRALVVVLVIVASAGLCYFAYTVARNQGVKEFEAKFRDYAHEIVRSSINNARNSKLVLESFARSVTSLAIFANSTWPLLTIPHYETRANDYITLSKAESITFAPVVPSNMRQIYENYTVLNQGWIQEGIDFEYQVHFRTPRFDQEPDSDDSTTTTTTPQEDDNGVVVNMEGFSVVDRARSIQPFIWTNAPLTHMAIPDISQGPYVPVWQTFPPPRNSYVVGNNLRSVPEFESLIQSAQETFLPTVSEVFDNNFRLFGSAQTIDVDPKSVLVQPIFQDLQHSQGGPVTVGYMVVIKKWHQIFQDVFYDGAKPLIVVLRHSTHQGTDQAEAFTYQVIGSKSAFLGTGDLHNTRYDSMEVTSCLFTPQVITSACNYTLHVYPTTEMEDAFSSNLPLLVLLTILSFYILLGTGFYLYDRTTKKHQRNRLKGQAQHEQALLRIDHARQAAAAERQLNEFIAHEVRNPLSAAMSACSFVSSAVQDFHALALKPPQQSTLSTHAQKPLFQMASPGQPAPLFAIPAAAPVVATLTEAQVHSQQMETHKESIMEDLHIIDSSLQFINELLRNMLDVQRAAHHQLTIEKAPTDVLRDILEPVDAMLYRRGKSEVKVIVECPPDTMVMTDRLRLKQVVLNLSRNSAKFVEKGYIKLKAVIVDRQVQIWIEDSGPGIPEEKKGQLFSKFQESLDSLNQGTGLGLSLCKILIGLLGGEVWLDEDFDSGMEGRPGARFVIDLHTAPLKVDEFSTQFSIHAADIEAPLPTETDNNSSNQISVLKDTRMMNGGKLTNGSDQTTMESEYPSLPCDLVILVVDDDTVLRKLIVRAIRRIAPSWKIQEAASGEAALRVIDEMGDGSQLDLIFLDQYMASTEKQLLGTETAKALRSKGVRSKICGLSANDMANDFLAAGADAFVCKPLPTKEDKLRQVLSEILFACSPSEGALSGFRGKRSSLVITPTSEGY